MFLSSFQFSNIFDYQKGLLNFWATCDNFSEPLRTSPFQRLNQRAAACDERRCHGRGPMSGHTVCCGHGLGGLYHDTAGHGQRCLHQEVSVPLEKSLKKMIFFVCIKFSCLSFCWIWMWFQMYFREPMNIQSLSGFCYVLLMPIGELFAFTLVVWVHESAKRVHSTSYQD